MNCPYCHMSGTYKEVEAHKDNIHKTEMFRL